MGLFKVGILKARIILCVLHFLGSLILYLLVSLFGLGDDYGLFLAYSIVTIVVFSILFLSEARFNGLSLLLLFLLAAFMRLVIPAYEMSIELLDGEKFSYARDYSTFVFPAVLGMNVYYTLFILLLTRFSKDKYLSFRFEELTNIKHMRLFAIIIFIIGAISTIIEAFPILDSLRGHFSQLMLVSLILLAFYCAYKDDKGTLRLFYILISLNVIIALFFGFYKSKIILPIATYVLYYYLYCRRNQKHLINVKFIGLVIFLALFLFGFVYPFMTLKRVETQWDPDTNEVVAQYSNIDFIQRVLKGETNFQEETREERTSAIADRQNAIPVNSFFYMSAYERGFNTRLLKEALTLSLPRWLGGSGKETIGQGYLAEAYLFSESFNIAGVSSNSYVGVFASSYFWGGWFAVFLMCMFNAWFISFLFEFSQKNVKNIFALIILLSILLSSVACFEEVHDGGIMWAKNTFLLYLFAIITKKINKSLNKLLSPQKRIHESIN